VGATPLDTSTWKNAPGIPVSGGGTWTSLSLDPKSGLLYVPGGNPAPDFVNSVREGPNLYSDSVVVLDAKTGAYKKHFQIVPHDYHDWDVSNPPVLINSAGGKHLMAVSPKDGFLYGFDLADDKQLYKTAVTKIENAEAPFSTETETHFCPGAAGGGEWNSPGYNPQTNLIYTGDVDWCTTVKIQKVEQLAEVGPGKLWMGEHTLDPADVLGAFSRADGTWGGWLHAVDADTGEWKWKVRTNYPIIGAVTPTAGGLVFFGDVGGNFYAVDASSGEKLFGQKVNGAIGGGLITYTVNGAQKVAVTMGVTNAMFPVRAATAKIAILGLEGGAP
jgi:alcohol dehydrogenase (cytochrome c)